MFLEYEAKNKALKRWAEHSKSDKLKPYLNKRKELQFIFALGIYYRWVIAPIARSGAFFERANNKGINGVTLGGIKLDREFQTSTLKAKDDFYKIIEWYGLSESFLSLTDIKSIVLSLVELEERQRND